MKHIKLTVLLALGIFFTNTIFAQNAALSAMLKEMTQEERLELLEFAKKEQLDVERELTKIMKTLPKSSQNKVMQYAENILEDRTKAYLPPSVREIKEVPVMSSEPKQPTTKMTFEKESFDFGTVKEGKLVSYTFKFKNTGEHPLTITNAKGSCGCTIPKYSKQPIQPGKTGEITVNFNSKGKVGKRNQTVTITANTTPQRKVVRLVGEVLKAQ